jgi:hypothetical protein
MSGSCLQGMFASSASRYIFTVTRVRQKVKDGALFDIKAVVLIFNKIITCERTRPF